MGSLRLILHGRRLARHALERGFTLIEMLIVIAIISIITLVVITSQGSFNKSLVLSNAAYDLALAMRNVETYGLASRIATSGATNTGYGLEFTVGNTFTLFADSYPGPSQSGCHGLPINGVSAPDAKNGNCVYDSNKNEKVTTYTLNNGIKISQACYSTATAQSCTPSFGRLDIVFVRPDPTPFFSPKGSYDPTVTKVCLALTSPQGGSRYVAINATGEIDASAPSCP